MPLITKKPAATAPWMSHQAASLHAQDYAEVHVCHSATDVLPAPEDAPGTAPEAAEANATGIVPADVQTDAKGTVLEVVRQIVAEV